MQHVDILTELAALQHAEGGWAYAQGQRPHLEPTCISLLALATERDRFADTIARGFACLKSFRRSDGSYRLDRGRAEAVWGTALALLTLHELRGDAKELEQTASFLLGVRGKPGQEDPETDAAFDIDIKLIGWPWAEGTFSWVEPTAWACLALQKAGQAQHSRVQEGLQLLLNRVFTTGGANYGNRRIFEKQTDPIPGPSATLLLALQHHNDDARVRSSIDYITNDAMSSHDLEHLGLTKVALNVLGCQDNTSLDQRIRDGLNERRNLSWSPVTPLRLAWAALGLGAEKANAFRVPPVSVTELLTEQPLRPYRPSLGVRIKDGFGSLLARGISKLRQPVTRSAVHIARAGSYDDDLAAILRTQYEHFRDLVPLSGRRVVLKPNLVEFHRAKVINTDPRVIGAMIELCKTEGASEVIVAEGPGHWRNVEYLVAESGLGEVLTKHGVRFVDINHDEPVKLANLGRLTGLDHLFVSQTVATADVLISMPKLKTHHWAGATLSLKNLFGILPGICYGWPKNELHWRGIAESIVDIALTCTPHLALIDGIMGMEGDGPLNGEARAFGALIMGNDLVATDATGCRLMGLPAERIVHIALAAHKRLGRIKPEEIEQVGEAVASLAKEFALPPRFEKITLPEPKAVEAAITPTH